MSEKPSIEIIKSAQVGDNFTIAVTRIGEHVWMATNERTHFTDEDAALDLFYKIIDEESERRGVTVGGENEGYCHDCKNKGWCYKWRSRNGEDVYVGDYCDCDAGKRTKAHDYNHDVKVNDDTIKFDDDLPF